MGRGRAEVSTERTVGRRAEGTVPCLPGEPGRLQGPKEGTVVWGVLV